jgi:hypothetical protein
MTLKEIAVTLKEIAVTLNVSTDRVYYIFRKLRLKTKCKKEGGKWVVSKEAFWDMRRENDRIKEKKHLAEIKKRSPELQAYADSEGISCLDNKTLEDLFQSAFRAYQSKIGLARLATLKNK